jgi:hypothetical protein
MKCTRCNRTLKKEVMIGGMPYGPVCARKVARPDEEGKESAEGVITGSVFVGKRIYEPGLGPEWGKQLDIEKPSHVVVTADGQPLDYRLDLRNHSPTGFEWGYAGSGPAQLALALCAAVMHRERALECYQQFKFNVVGRLPKDGWTLTREQVLMESNRALEAEVAHD